MTTLTIYSNNFDEKDGIANNGMSGKAFLDVDNLTGVPFDNMDTALDYITTNNVEIHRVEFNYVDKSGVQVFKKFMIGQPER